MKGRYLTRKEVSVTVQSRRYINSPHESSIVRPLTSKNALCLNDSYCSHPEFTNSGTFHFMPRLWSALESFPSQPAKYFVTYLQVYVSQDNAGLPFLSSMTGCVFSAKNAHIVVPSTKTSNGMIMTVRYSAALLSEQSVPQYGLVSILMADH